MSGKILFLNENAVEPDSAPGPVEQHAVLVPLPGRPHGVDLGRDHVIDRARRSFVHRRSGVIHDLHFKTHPRFAAGARDRGMDKDAAVAPLIEFEFREQFKILILVFRTNQIRRYVFTAAADLAGLHHPGPGIRLDVPSVKITTVEQRRKSIAGRLKQKSHRFLILFSRMAAERRRQPEPGKSFHAQSFQ
ncbi:MAG: hypothetical protein BWY83_02437 [bacterium ADurb.Bin478]|nr:MAG: hypothetical protein BWY83_02437 [bacterium ADurb.Bin478]